MLKILGKLLSSLARAQMNSTPVSGNAFFSRESNDTINIQLQDNHGNWRTCQGTPNIPMMIVDGMKQVAAQHPDKRVRAVNENGSIVDIL